MPVDQPRREQPGQNEVAAEDRRQRTPIIGPGAGQSSAAPYGPARPPLRRPRSSRDPGARRAARPSRGPRRRPARPRSERSRRCVRARVGTPGPIPAPGRRPPRPRSPTRRPRPPGQVQPVRGRRVHHRQGHRDDRQRLRRSAQPPPTQREAAGAGDEGDPGHHGHLAADPDHVPGHRQEHRRGDHDEQRPHREQHLLRRPTPSPPAAVGADSGRRGRGPSSRRLRRAPQSRQQDRAALLAAPRAAGPPPTARPPPVPPRSTRRPNSGWSPGGSAAPQDGQGTVGAQSPLDVARWRHCIHPPARDAQQRPAARSRPHLSGTETPNGIGSHGSGVELSRILTS